MTFWANSCCRRAVADILRGTVASENPVSPAAGPGRSETNMLKTFGFVRSK